MAGVTTMKKEKSNSPMSARPAITSQKERYGSVDGERRAKIA